MKAVVGTLRVLYLPFIIYGLFALLKITVPDLPVDLPGMHAVLGVVFIIAGGAICYFMSILRFILPASDDIWPGPYYWHLSSLLFLILFFDAAFGIHERMSFFGLPEIAFFIVEGGMLVSIVAPYFRKWNRVSYMLFGVFVLASAIAILGDTAVSGEGTLILLGRQFSYEQSLETFSMFLLACFFAQQGMENLKEIYLYK